MNPEKYLTGLTNHHNTEAVPGAVPREQNSPQKHSLGLYPEQFSTSAFTMPRVHNKRSWLYRIRPSALKKTSFVRSNSATKWLAPGTQEFSPTPNALRWNPLPEAKPGTTFKQGVFTLIANGSIENLHGCANHVYAFNTPMKKEYFYNADAEMMFIPYQGSIEIKTEMGVLDVEPLEIAVIPRGIKIQVNPKEHSAKGYLHENFGSPFELPDLGPIGANGLADARHFEVPRAQYEQLGDSCRITAKIHGQFWDAELMDSPLDVVGWHGNTFPYKYHLSNFNVINTVSFDHPDPSIFTVLTSRSETPGMANVDFVIFPPRWMVAEHTFRPPYFHRNMMSEFMGLIKGVYDAKIDGGFVSGGASLHNCMTPHGPDAKSYEGASNADLKPHYISETMAFMFESRYPYAPTKQALETPLFQKDYDQCWAGLKAQFKG